MLPGKKYGPEDLLAIVRQRVWFLLVPFAVVAAVTAVVARWLPDTYQAQALVAVVRQQVPESIVRPAVTTGLDERLQTIQEQVLSRPRLEKIILELNLYPEERRTGIMEDIIQRMKTRDLGIRRISPVTFRVTYNGRDPVSTMKVVEHVASAFINESLSDRSRLTDQTNNFLDSATETARQELAKREQQLVDYRLRHSGELPTQLEANLRQMGNLYAQVQNIQLAVNNLRQSRILLERQLATELETPAAAAASAPPEAPQPAGRGGAPSAARTLAQARLDFEALSARYTPAHPDVQRAATVIQDLEAKAAAEAAASPAVRGLPIGASPAEVLRARRIDELQKQLEENDAQVGKHLADEKRLRDEAAVFQARVEAAPRREAELTELMREYPVLQASYAALRQKSEQAQLSASLESRQIGEQFRLLEPATVPVRPASPDRMRISLFGMAGGLALGVALVGLLEFRDSGFTTDGQVTELLGLPVLAVVPVMKSDPERRRERAWTLLVRLGLGGTVAACLAVLAYTFVR
jgi:polysaccharide chain length determinant protein (PEP-CTERM system associated)